MIEVATKEDLNPIAADAKEALRIAKVALGIIQGLDYVTVEQAAKILGKHKTTVLRMIKDPTTGISYKKDGYRSVSIPMQDLLQYNLKHTIK